ncbi:NAD(P)/FAD-dependent oxidoreductase [Tropicimonas isoalkanivorans]|uniref:Thioredoxin reductase n=1 Tax=Tropicimonas isoalkanivorans TaxID=441112 RepID=A0A1I1DED1_9RHOB|nr:NAD(P)/FAD-dependent oxidoreductase [Tropicimonas isoalkanivorans]SFB73174.1 Thioredoxin reductase [Tropicimonas isoalkanivorans]
MTRMPESVDVVIVGGGPAGLSAAAELKRLGIGSVLVLERDREAGGVPRFCGHSPYGLREFRRPMFGPSYARALEQRARQAGADIRTSATVTSLRSGPCLTVSTDDGLSEVRARAVLISTGVRETPRAARLIGGTKPGGVMVTGALQSLVYGTRMRPFRRPIILGTELVSFSAILTCLHAGIRPVAMVEPSDRIIARHPADLLPKGLRVPLHLSSDVAEIHGSAQVDGAILTTADGPVALETDGVVVTGKFRPESALARLAGLAIDPGTGGPRVDECGRCSMPGVYAAGNLLRPVETAGWCWAEGRAVARAIASDLNAAARGGGGAISIAGGPLKYVMPQRLSGDARRAFDKLQLRVNRPARGRLSLLVDGREVSGRAISALPERRILLPLPPEGCDAQVVFEEGT